MIIHNDQHHIKPRVYGLIRIVLTPTQELAEQVYTHAKTFIECIGGKAVKVAGGNHGTWELTGFEVSWYTLALEITSVYNTMYPT